MGKVYRYSPLSLSLKVTILSLFEKSGAKNAKTAISITNLRDKFDLEAHHKLNSECQDMEKSDILGRSGKSSNSVKWYIKSNGDVLLKENRDKIVDRIKLYELFGPKKNIVSNQKQPDLNLSVFAHSSIEGIIQLEKDRDQLVRFLLSLEAMISSQLDKLLPERVQQQDTSM